MNAPIEVSTRVWSDKSAQNLRCNSIKIGIGIAVAGVPAARGEQQNMIALARRRCPGDTR